MLVLTFDIEDWFHILDNDSTKNVDSWNGFESRLEEGTDRILGLLQRKKIKASFFVLGWVALRYPGVVKKIHSCGYEIGSHSYAHQLAFEQGREAFREDLLKSIALLGEITGYRPQFYRAPGFSLCQESLWVFDELCRAGIPTDCSVFPAERAHGGLPGYHEGIPGTIETDAGPIKCLPVNTHTFFGRRMVVTGGGYFRLFPYAIIRHFLKKGGYGMTYFHPRDFDALQPMIPGLSAVRRFKSYTGIKGAFKKLERMTAEFETIDIRGAVSAVDWERSPRYRLAGNTLTQCTRGTV